MAGIRFSWRLFSQTVQITKNWKIGCNLENTCKVWSCTANVPRYLHVSPSTYGMDDFFDTSDRIGERQVKSGSSWSKSLLRKKSIEDLHKLWFVLLKERNMLNTLEYYCIDEDEPMPGPDRLEKVAESMSNLRDVIEERERAKNMLLHGTPDKRQREWRKSPLGLPYLYRPREHFIPEELQLVKRGDRHADMAYFDRRLEEMHLRMEETRMKKRDQYKYSIRLKWNRLRRNNPHLPRKTPKWYMDKFKTTWKYGIHPSLPIFNRPHDERFHKTKGPTYLPGGVPPGNT